MNTTLNTWNMSLKKKSVDRGFSFALVLLLVNQVKCFDNFQTTFNPMSYDQLKNYSWIYCRQASAVGNAVENWMTVICQLMKMAGEMENILIKDLLKIMSQSWSLLACMGNIVKSAPTPLGKTLMMEFIEYQKQNWLAYLTHYGLVTPYSDIYLGQHWLG